MPVLTIDGRKTEVAEGATILEACEQIGVEIPTLCHLKPLTAEGACRMCLVEVEGARALQTACSTPCTEGMVVHSKSEPVVNARRFVLDLMLSNHNKDCFACAKSGECKLQNYCYEYGVEEATFTGERVLAPIDKSSPFFDYDPEKCILCHRCVRTCHERQANNTLSTNGRGFGTNVGLPFGKDFDNYNCVSCGNCVSACPTGALTPKVKDRFRLWEVEKTLTTCSYCGVGCQMNLLTKDNKVVGVEPADGPTNQNLLCVKGKFAYNFINHPDRLTQPLIRKDGELVEATWDEALDLVAGKIKAIKGETGADSIAGFASARATNEENYAFMKMMRAVIGTNNVDHCARLCHASTVAGLATTLGSGAMTNSIPETVEADVIFVTGSNTTETHPVIGAQIRQALLRGAKLIVAEPRRIDLAEQADIFLQIKPGTNVALYNGMMNVVLTEGLADMEYVNARTEEFEALKEVIKDYTPEHVAEICGIDADELRAAARLYAKADKAPIFYSMGVTQHSTGTAGVMGTSNLALLCGKIGKRGCGVNPLRGQNNVQGACDMGCLPGDYTGYQKVANEAARKKFEAAWGVELPTAAGLTVNEVMDAIIDDKIRCLYIMGENPMISDPDLNHVEHALNKCEFLVVQDIFLTETAMLADVVLPACTFAEKDGTFTATDRRVQRIRAAIPMVGDSRADWDILKDVMARLGYENSFNSPEEIMAEIAAITPQYGGINFTRLETESLCWPCPDATHPGTPTLHTKAFSRGERALFVPHHYKPSAELPDADYPFILTTGRVLHQYHTRTMTGKSEGVNKLGGVSIIEINPADATKLGINDGDIINVASRRGEVQTKAVVTDKLKAGVVFMPFHYADGPANKLTNAALDPIAKIPEFKVCAVSIKK
ncbi:formate dehydrogenase subunit alpha [Eubacteriales bacterium OttesenSCG-928-K08]|nr:formate dehydrogenase subunit alpha [Eubacteriales bacterium OttesenSCG-928-K08]